ncbi:putative CRISPR-associated protein [Candidatus Poribacteria bacterium]|nr:putative CRISPR-associated protein [Candidatus Poribacteria bacterium]
MRTSRPQHLICTVGVSLFLPNLNGLRAKLLDGTIPPERKKLAEAYVAKDWPRVAQELDHIDANEQICGAEINSVASMIEKQYVAPNCGLFFLHSETEAGNDVATILRAYYEIKGHTTVKTISVKDLQDEDPKRFRTKGLRNLAREVCALIRDYSPHACAINATGGYKAQIAIGVLLGQAIGVPVYYKHERFPEIIAFPPMPVALDFELWMRASGMLYDLSRTLDPVPEREYADEWDERYESLVERVSIDGVAYLELSPTGQIFHETFRERFRTARDEVLPPTALTKFDPRIERAGWRGVHPEVEEFMSRVTNEVPQVVQCSTFYYNPDLPSRARFRLGSGGIEGIFSNGTYTVKFRVETTAKTPGQSAAVVAFLNQWLSDQA